MSFNFEEIFPVFDENGYIDEERWRVMSEITNRYTPPVNPEAYFRENNLIVHDGDEANGGGGENYNPFLNWTERWMIDGRTIRVYNEEPGVFLGPEIAPHMEDPEPQVAAPEPPVAAPELQVAAPKLQVAAPEPQEVDPELHGDEPPNLIPLRELNREDLER